MAAHQLPGHLASAEVAAWQLIRRNDRLEITLSEGLTMPIHVVRQRGTHLGPASQWLLANLKDRLSDWKPCAGSAKAEQVTRNCCALSQQLPSRGAVTSFRRVRAREAAA